MPGIAAETGNIVVEHRCAAVIDGAEPVPSVP